MAGRQAVSGWRRILVATDFSRPARVALNSAVALSREAHAQLVLTHVVELPPTTYAYGGETWVSEARRTLRATAARLYRRGLVSVEVDVRVGKPWVQIIESARSHGADMIVLGNAGRSRFERLLLGSTAENVVRHSLIPVLVTRSRPLRGLRRVLVPVSFDEGSRAALEFAAGRLPRTVQIEAFHAAMPVPGRHPWLPVLPASVPQATKELRAFLATAGAKRVRPRVEAVSNPAGAILSRARAWKADLILLSTHGRGGFSHLLLGSVAEKVARYADRPVLVIPPPGRGASMRQSVPQRRSPSRFPVAALAIPSKAASKASRSQATRPVDGTSPHGSRRTGGTGRRGDKGGMKTHR